MAQHKEILKDAFSLGHQEDHFHCETIHETIEWSDIKDTQIRLLLHFPTINDHVHYPHQYILENINFLDGYVFELVRFLLFARGCSKNIFELISIQEFEALLGNIQLKFPELSSIKTKAGEEIFNPNFRLVSMLLLNKHIIKLFKRLNPDLPPQLKKQKFMSFLEIEEIKKQLNIPINSHLSFQWKLKPQRKSTITVNHYVFHQGGHNSLRNEAHAHQFSITKNTSAKDIHKVIRTLIKPIDAVCFDAVSTRRLVSPSATSLSKNEKEVILQVTNKRLENTSATTTTAATAAATAAAATAAATATPSVSFDDYDNEPFYDSTQDTLQYYQEMQEVNARYDAEASSDDEEDQNNDTNGEEDDVSIERNNQLVQEMEESLPIPDLNSQSSDDSTQTRDQSDNGQNDQSDISDDEVEDDEVEDNVIENNGGQHRIDHFQQAIPKIIPVGNVDSKTSFVIHLHNQLREITANVTQAMGLKYIAKYATGNYPRQVVDDILRDMRCMSSLFLGQTKQMITGLRHSYATNALFGTGDSDDVAEDDVVARDPDSGRDAAVEEHDVFKKLDKHLPKKKENFSEAKARSRARKLLNERETFVKELSVKNRFCETFQDHVNMALIKEGLMKKIFICPLKCATSYNFEEYFDENLPPVGVKRGYKWTCPYCKRANVDGDWFYVLNPKVFITSLFLNNYLGSMVKTNYKRAKSFIFDFTSQIGDDDGLQNYSSFYTSKFLAGLRGRTLGAKLSNGQELKDPNTKYYEDITLSIFISTDGIALNSTSSTWPFFVSFLDLGALHQNGNCMFRGMTVPLHKLPDKKHLVDSYIDCFYDMLSLLEVNGTEVVDSSDGNRTKRVRIATVGLAGDLPAQCKFSKMSGARGLCFCRYCIIFRYTYRKKRDKKGKLKNGEVVDLNKLISNDHYNYRPFVEKEMAYLFSSKEVRGTIDNKNSNLYTDGYFDLNLKTKAHRDNIFRLLEYEPDFSTIFGIKQKSRLFEFSNSLDSSFGLLPDAMHICLENITASFLHLLFSNRKDNVCLTSSERQMISSLVSQSLLPTSFSRPLPSDISTFLKADQLYLVCLILPEILESTSVNRELKELVFKFRVIFKFLFSNYILESSFDFMETHIKNFVSHFEEFVKKHDLPKMISCFVHELIHLVELTKVFGPLGRFNCFSNERGVGSIKKGYYSTFGSSQNTSKQHIALYSVFQMFGLTFLSENSNTATENGVIQQAFERSCLNHLFTHHHFDTIETFTTDELDEVNYQLSKLSLANNGSTNQTPDVVISKKRYLSGPGSISKLENLPNLARVEVLRSVSTIIRGNSDHCFEVKEYKTYKFETFLGIKTETLQCSGLSKEKIDTPTISPSNFYKLKKSSCCILSSFGLVSKKTFKDGLGEREDYGNGENVPGAREKVFFGMGHCHQIFQVKLVNQITKEVVKEFNIGVFKVVPLQTKENGHLWCYAKAPGEIVAVDLDTTSIKALAYQVVEKYMYNGHDVKSYFFTKEPFLNWDRFLECSLEQIKNEVES